MDGVVTILQLFFCFFFEPLPKFIDCSFIINCVKIGASDKGFKKVSLILDMHRNKMIFMLLINTW